ESTVSTADPPAGPAFDYGDYARWQRDRLAGDGLTELTDFWRGALDGAPVLEFPTDRMRPPELTYPGSWVRRLVALPGGRAAAGALARSLGSTPNAVYLAAFLTLLHRCSGQDDLVVGTPTANREYTEVERVCGYFINMLPMRFDLA